MKKPVVLFVISVILFLTILLWLKNKSVAPPEKVFPEVVIAKALANASPQVTAIIQSNFSATPNNSALTEKILSTPTETTTQRAGKANLPEVTTMEPRVVLDNVHNAISNYGQRFGGNPVGSNAEITRALDGENPGQVHFLKAEAGMRVNEKGELIDAWGTPYFFHQLSSAVMEIHSAGADKIMWTDDDLVSH